MKAMTKFIRTTLAGGILFMIPLVIILSVVKRSLGFVSKVTAPLTKHMDEEIIWGMNGDNLVGIAVLLTLCFLCGLLFRFAPVQSSINKLEEKFLSYIPGYTLLKSLANDALRETRGESMVPIFVKEGKGYRPGFLIEQKGKLCTVFLPEAPQANTGELQVVSNDVVIKVSISASAMNYLIRNLGKGTIEYIPENA